MKISEQHIEWMESMGRPQTVYPDTLMKLRLWSQHLNSFLVFDFASSNHYKLHLSDSSFSRWLLPSSKLILLLYCHEKLIKEVFNKRNFS